MSRNGTSPHTPLFFKKPRIIFTTLLAAVLCLGSVLVVFGGEREMTDPIQEVTLNIAVTGLIFLYLSLLALLPFSWMKDGVDENCHRAPLFFKKPRIIFTTLLAAVLCLGSMLVVFGGEREMTDPIQEVTLNIAVTGLIFLYLSLLALLPFSWMKDGVDGNCHRAPLFFKKPRIIFTTLLAAVLCLGGGFVLFGGHFALLNPINGLTLNIAVTGLIFLYLSLLALLPFSWKRMKDSMNDKTYEQDNQRNGQ